MAAYIQGEFDFEGDPENTPPLISSDISTADGAFSYRPSPGIYDIIGKSIGLAKNGSLTRHTWQKLYTILEIYRDKRYETFRYLLVNNRGFIKDHAALTAFHPSLSPTIPPSIGEGYFIHQIKQQAQAQKCGVILVHNHPSGNILPSSEDIAINDRLKKKLGGFYRGHIILDHGEFSFYDIESSSFSQAQLDMMPAPDPLAPKTDNDYIGFLIKQPGNEHFLRSAIRIDSGDKWNSRDWVPIFFLDNSHKIRSLHYYHITEFTSQNADTNILNKSSFIARSEGSTNMYALPADQHMFDTLANFSVKISLFMDVVYNGASLLLTRGYKNSLSNFFPLETSFTSSFELTGLPPFPLNAAGSLRAAAANPPEADGSPGTAGEKGQAAVHYHKTPAPDPRFVHNDPPAYAVNPSRKEPAVSDLTIPQNLRDRRMAVEYLDRLLSIRDPHNRLAYHNSFTRQAAFARLKDLPDFSRLAEQYRETFQAYRNDYPESRPPSAPAALTGIPLPAEKPSQFLSKAAVLPTPQAYRAYYRQHFNFQTGEIREVSPGMLALFSDQHSLPLALGADQPPAGAALYKQADEHGIALRGFIPTPDAVDACGMDHAGKSLAALQNLMDNNAGRPVSPEDRRTRLEYLEMLLHTSPDQRGKVHQAYTAVSDFQKLAAFPRFGDLDGHYRECLQAYRRDYPDDRPPFYNPVKLVSLSQPSTAYTPFQFLKEASRITSPRDYTALYNLHYEDALPTAQVRMVSPDTIALFMPPQKLPRVMTAYSPENAAELYKLADHNGIVPVINKSQPLIPSPEEAAADPAVIAERLHTLEDLLSPVYHARQFPPAPPPRRKSPDLPPDPAVLFTNFVNNPFSPGVRIPAFGVMQNGTLKLMEGYSFLKTEDSGHTVCLSRRGGGGFPETAKISRTHYGFIVNAADAPASAKELTPEIIQKYEQTVLADVDKTRPNTAANFWHNFRVLARKEALNPADAAVTARRVMYEMDRGEREKLLKSLAVYEKQAGVSANNRITHYYDDVVRDIPLKNRSPHDGQALSTLRYHDDAVDTRGKPIDGGIRLRIGEPVTLNLKIPDLITGLPKKVLTANLYLASSSESLNKVVIMSADNTSKYILPRDSFIQSMEKVEKRREKQREIRNRIEYRKMIRESIDFDY
jgi:proteasome lid subunit RPN8/RPN11